MQFSPSSFTGERRLKLTGESNRLDVNADFMTTGTLLNTPTLYPSAYLVLTSKGYTKHYYAGADLCASREQSQACLSYAETKQSVRSNRVAASLGGGGLKAVGSNPGMQERANGLFWESHERVNGRMLQENDHECIWQSSLPAWEYYGFIKDIPGRMNASVEFYLNDLYDNLKMLAEEQHDEKDVYFYHSDHLGSASWITDADGKPIQHLQYLPFGEPFVNQHLTDYQERYLFTGKERDEETGYGYFGARYMDHELTAMWLSVDPMADKYPSISPYAYCAWNPIKLVDPDGRDVWEVDAKGHAKNVGSEGGDKTQTIKYSNGKTSVHKGSYYHSILSDLSNEKEKKGELSSHNGNEKQGAAMADIFYEMATNTNVEWRLDYTKEKQFILSSIHDVGLSPSASKLGLSFDDMYSTIHSHPAAEADYTKETESMGIVRGKNYAGGDYSLRNQQPKSLKSYVFMKNSLRCWELRPFKNPGRVGDSKGDDIQFSNGSQILKLLKL